MRQKKASMHSDRERIGEEQKVFFGFCFVFLIL